MAADAEEIPQDLKTRYSDFRLLGSGAMGRVYKATDRDLLIDVAIKVLLANRGPSSDAGIRFQREAKAASKLTHRNLVRIMDFGIASGDQLYLVMEFAKGETLESILADQSIGLNDGVRVISQICDGMTHAHSLGVVHRDLKPANIMVDGDNLNDASIKVIDFGVAKMGDTTGTAGSLTQHGELIGTPQFMSPEQISSNSNIDGRSDIYSVGCILFYLLTGRHPHEGKTLLELLQSKLNDIAPRINEVGHEPVPMAVEEVVARCLSANPDDRFSTMLELKQALLLAAQHADRSGLAISGANGVVPSQTQTVVRKFGFVAVVFFAIIVFVITIATVDRVSRPSTEISSKSVEAPPKKSQLNKTEKLQELFYPDHANPTSWSADLISNEDLKLLIGQDVKVLKLDAQPKLTDGACSYFSKFPNLSVLSIQDAQIGDKGIALLSDCKKLCKLFLGGTEITDSGLASIVDLPLEDLGIERTKISGAGMKYIAKLKSLTRLKVTLTDFDDQGLKAIVNLPLECIHVESTLITDKGMKFLPGKKTMRRLYAEHTAIGEPGLRQIASYPIDQLCLAGCSAVDDHCVDFIARTWPNLSKLTISGSKITGEGMKKIARLPHMQDLRLVEMQLSDKDISPIFEIKGLTELTLIDLPITDKTLARCSELSLKKIDISGCKQTTARGKEVMSERCFSLGQSDAKSILQKDSAVESVTNTLK